MHAVLVTPATARGRAGIALLCCAALTWGRSEAQPVASEFAHEPLPEASPEGVDAGAGAVDWVAANAAVAEIGGWRAYARERDGALASDPVTLYLDPSGSNDAAEAFERLEAALADEPVDRATQIRRAWVDAVAAGQRLDHVGKLHASAGATAELARRMASVGNLSGLSHARARLRYADASVLLASARLDALASRERLERLLGPDRTRLRTDSLPTRLPDVPERPLPPGAIDDVSRRGGATMPSVSLASWRSGLRESYRAYRTHHDIAMLYRDEILPLRASISEEHVYRYGGMLIGTFDLLADSRDSIRAVLRAIEASRQFWRADAALRAWSSGVPVRVSVPSIVGDENAWRDVH